MERQPGQQAHRAATKMVGLAPRRFAIVPCTSAPIGAAPKNATP